MGGKACRMFLSVTTFSKIVYSNRQKKASKNVLTKRKSFYSFRWWDHIQYIIFGGLSGLCPGRVLVSRIFLRSKLHLNRTKPLYWWDALEPQSHSQWQQAGRPAAAGLWWTHFTGSSASGMHTLECELLQTHRIAKAHHFLGYVLKGPILPAYFLCVWWCMCHCEHMCAASSADRTFCEL